MFGQDGKYVAEFSINNNENFIEQNNLINFTIIEQAGNLLPVFRLLFKTFDDKLPAYINEGNELRVSLGSSVNTIENYSLVFQNSESFRSGKNVHVISATGMLNKIDYLDTKIRITDKINAATALKNIGGEFFIVDSNLDLSSADKMYWKQYNISAKRFINDIWLANYIPDSFPVVGITCEGKLIIRDIKKMLNAKKESDWSVDSAANPTKYIPISPNYRINSKKGFFNTYTGIGREKFIYDQDDAVGLIQSEEIKAYLALSEKLMYNAKREKKRFDNGVINENVHPNYHKAYLRNITSLANYSSIKLKFRFDNVFKPVKIYDTLYFRDISPDGISSSEYSAGDYIITKVVKKLSSTSLAIISEGCRESFNLPKGDLV